MTAARVDHRWLSSHDAAVTDEPMLRFISLSEKSPGEFK